MGNIPNTNVFECIETCNEAREFPGIKIIRYEESVYYANVDNFKYHIIKISQTNPNEIANEIDRAYAVEVKKLMKAYAIQKKLIKLQENLQKEDYREYVLGDVIYSNLVKIKYLIKYLFFFILVSRMDTYYLTKT